MTKTTTAAATPDRSEMKRRVALARSVLNWWTDDPARAVEFAAQALSGAPLSELVDRHRRAQGGAEKLF